MVGRGLATMDGCRLSVVGCQLGVAYCLSSVVVCGSDTHDAERSHTRWREVAGVITTPRPWMPDEPYLALHALSPRARSRAHSAGTRAHCARRDCPGPRRAAAAGGTGDGSPGAGAAHEAVIAPTGQF